VRRWFLPSFSLPKLDHGWAEMKRDLYEIHEEAAQLRAARGKVSPPAGR
jgi:hypothetical protein